MSDATTTETPMKPGDFKIHKKDPSSRARLGELQTTHGKVETPIFMPVGTQATVKSFAPRELEECGSQIVLSNTYHLYIRPGLEVINTVGGLHNFMGWKKPILTDSGGFQVFSLARLRKISDEGVQFQSHVDGAPLFLGPREAVEIQRTLGSDIMMAFDECPPWPAEKSKVQEAVRRSVMWAKICKEHLTSIEPGPTENQLLFPIVQGGEFEDLREDCAKALVDLDMPGYAIGGVSVGEPEAEMMKAVRASEPHLPEEKPRYVMGVGQPNQLIQMIALGVDMFDCVLPTRVARNGTAYTSTGTMNLRNAAYAKDPRPIEEGCSCYACQNFSRAYIRHLLKSEEILGLRLVTFHNLHFYLRLMEQARRTLWDGTFGEWAAEFLANYKGREENA